MASDRAIRQLKEISKLSESPRLAAEGWDEDWKTLIAILMSARTLDKTTIPVAQKLFEEYTSLERLSKAGTANIGKIILPVNFYRNKSKYISQLSKMLLRDFDGKVPRDFEKLVELPGVGRKTANVFLAEQGEGRIGVDTHVNWISKQMGWTKSDKQEQVEKDLASIFPKRMHGKVNEILVRFGQTHRSRAKKVKMLKKIKSLK